MQPQLDVPLAPLTTFGLPAHADRFWAARSLADLDALPRSVQPMVLGGGSNLVLTSPRIPDVLRFGGVQRRAVRLDDAVQVTVEAGMDWHALVLWSVREKLWGLENLALIPGHVGAAPVQNIGAYGVELADVFVSLNAFDLEHRKPVMLAATDCAFGYRDSLFKQDSPDRWLITDVTLRLATTPRPRLHYAGVAEALAGNPAPTSADIAAAITSIRRAKLPDPARIGNAGSFFKNPVVAQRTADALRDEWPDLPVHAMSNGNAKLSAAWLIDRAGLKGHCVGGAAVSTHHALVLVNHGGATGADVRRLADDVQRRVAELFSVQLVPEPRIV